MTKKNKKESVPPAFPEWDEAALAAVAEHIKAQMQAEGLIKERKARAPSYNVAFDIKTDRGAEYIKSAKRRLEMGFLAGTRDNHKSLGTLTYEVEGGHYRAVFERDGKETVLIDEDI